MALTWDLTACAETPEVLWSDDRKAVTETLIFATISIGIGSWTAENAPEVFGRIALLERVYGAFLRATDDAGNVTDRHITPDDVRALIGLRTNVGKPETRASFLKRHAGYKVDNGAHAYTVWTA